MPNFSLKALYALALAYLLIGVNSASIVDLSKKSGGFLKLDFDVQQTQANLTTANEKRGSDLIAALAHGGSSYYADVYIGSNKQKNTVVLDTGSSDLWVLDSSIGSSQYGSYKSAASSTYKYLAPGFAISYGDKSSASGDWVKDTVSLSSRGPSVNLQFADVTQTGISSGILGVGYTSLETTSQTYPNFPQALADAGIINKNAYSLYLNSIDATSGSIIFGGIDNAKYSGKLVALPSVGESSRLDIQLNSATFNGKTYKINIAANVDSGTTLTYLPESFAKSLANAVFGANNYYQDSQSSLYFINSDCPTGVPNLAYNFNGVSITVPSSDFLIGGEGQCVLSVVPSSRFNLLGDTFLRHAYLVYDLQDRTISIAQVKYTTASDISVIS